MKIAIIGCGNMGGALAKRLSPSHTLYLYNIHYDKAEKLALEGYGKACKEISDAIQPAELIILAVKPQNIAEVSGASKSYLSKKKVVASLLSGITLHSLNRFFSNAPIIRLMPNLAAIHGDGVVGMCSNEKITSELQQHLTTLFEVLGKIYWIPEEKMDAFTALAGSGPAFVFPIIEAMVDAGIAMGFNSKDALDITLNMLQGSISLLKKSKKHPGDLKWTIASPQGTTIAGLREFENSAIRGAIMNVFIAAYERSKELSSIGK